MIFEIFVHNVNENRSGRELESALRARHFRVLLSDPFLGKHRIKWEKDLVYLTLESNNADIVLITRSNRTRESDSN